MTKTETDEQWAERMARGVLGDKDTEDWSDPKYVSLMRELAAEMKPDEQEPPSARLALFYKLRDEWETRAFGLDEDEK